jgi:hypothetical protein
MAHYHHHQHRSPTRQPNSIHRSGEMDKPVSNDPYYHNPEYGTSTQQYRAYSEYNQFKRKTIIFLL